MADLEFKDFFKLKSLPGTIGLVVLTYLGGRLSGYFGWPPILGGLAGALLALGYLKWVNKK